MFSDFLIFCRFHMLCTIKLLKTHVMYVYTSFYICICIYTYIYIRIMSPDDSRGIHKAILPCSSHSVAH